MSYKVRWSQDVLDKIKKQKDYINYDSPLAAKKWIASVKAKKDILKENPFIGRVIPEFNKSNFRELIIGNFRLGYIVEENTVDIVDFKNSKQQYITLDDS